MIWSLSWSNAARADLVHIWMNIAYDNEDAADRLIAKLERAVDRLANFPRSGPVRDDLGHELRAVTVSNYLVLYRVIAQTQSVALLRVVDARRDLVALFSGHEP